MSPCGLYVRLAGLSSAGLLCVEGADEGQLVVGPDLHEQCSEQERGYEPPAAVNRDGDVVVGRVRVLSIYRQRDRSFVAKCFLYVRYDFLTRQSTIRFSGMLNRSTTLGAWDACFWKL